MTREDEVLQAAQSCSEGAVLEIVSPDETSCAEDFVHSDLEQKNKVKNELRRKERVKREASFQRTVRSILQVDESEILLR